MAEHLHQMNITYSGTEDRLLLRTSTVEGDEYRVWLTRRFTRLLLYVLSNEMQKHSGHLLSLGARDKTGGGSQEGNFEKPYEEEKTGGLPLGEDGMLAYGVKSHNKPDGELFLQLHSETGVNLGFSLNESLLYMFHNLIMQGIENAGWDIPSESGAVAASAQVH